MPHSSLYWVDPHLLKLCVVQGVQARNLGVPILAEEMDRAKPKA
jgi:hypothetical protein